MQHVVHMYCAFFVHVFTVLPSSAVRSTCMLSVISVHELDSLQYVDVHSALLAHVYNCMGLKSPSPKLNSVFMSAFLVLVCSMSFLVLVCLTSGYNVRPYAHTCMYVRSLLKCVLIVLQYNMIAALIVIPIGRLLLPCINQSHSSADPIGFDVVKGAAMCTYALGEVFMWLDQ